MFNLIVVNSSAEVASGSFRLTMDRFLESTESTVRDQLRSLSSDAVLAIRSWPTILMQEGRSDERVAIGQLTLMNEVHRELAIGFRESSLGDILLNGQLWKLRNELLIDSFEFSRRHFAIKSTDALTHIADAGVALGSLIDSLPSPEPLPAPTRAAIITAKDEIAEWSHSEIDDLLFEFGVEGLSAGRDGMSRRDRALTIAKFIIDNPGAKTADDRLFSKAWVERSAREGNSHLLSVEPPAATSTIPGRPLAETSPEPFDESHSRDSQSHAAGESRRVFVVHGHDDEARTAVSEFIEECGLTPIVLHEQPNMGRHLLSKFIDEAEVVGYAVVLLTADDVGGKRGDDVQPRARQNVILELGYFLSHLGASRVCAMKTPGVETPSDFDGVVYVTLDEQGGWRGELRRELVAVGLIEA